MVLEPRCKLRLSESEPAPPRLRQAQSRAAPALTLPPRAPRPQEQEARALEEEARRLKRERGALAKQGRALLALPTKRERGQARPEALMPVGLGRALRLLGRARGCVRLSVQAGRQRGQARQRPARRFASGWSVLRGM